VIPEPLDLAIVTCVRGYGRYLHDWAEALAALTVRPAMVGIVDGADPADVVAVDAARARLEQAGFRVRTRSLSGETNLGVLRNAAVALADTEWIQHLDADDVALPTMLEDVAAAMSEADVVAIGYRRIGDLPAGPHQREKLYTSTTGPDALRHPTPCSGVSPFRRAFWERTPYRQDQRGGWDTSLWRDFARQGARFIATPRPGFLYRQHGDSVFNVRRLASDFTRALTEHQLQAAQRGDQGVTVIVPRMHGDQGERALTWAWLKRRLEAQVPAWQLLEGWGAPPWRKGAAIAQALPRATGRVLVLLDADCALPPEALEEAARLVESGQALWVVPHTLVRRINQETTAEVLAESPTVVLPTPTLGLVRPPYKGFAGGGCVVVSKAAYLTTGGIPPSFVGWGSEDECLAIVLDTLVGPHRRLRYDLLHLWHPERKRELGAMSLTRANRDLLAGYRAAAGDPGRMWQLVRGIIPNGLVATPFIDPALKLACAEQKRERAVQAHDLRQPVAPAEPIGGSFRLGKKARPL
jgi:glycosyltransferase involved in cell wall biosynthesis